MKYKKQAADNARTNVIGMLHIVEVRLIGRHTGEKTKQRLLMVGCEAADIERKLRWVFDSTKYSEISIVEIEKVREKIHVISSVVTQEKQEPAAIIKRSDGSVEVHGVTLMQEEYRPNLYAVGVITSMVAADEAHAIRKVGRALMASTLEVKSKNEPQLSDDSKITVEQIPMSSGYAKPRDVSAEVNSAHFVRG